MVLTFILALLTTIVGHAIWVTAVINFLWLLVKEVTLFSWWVPIYLIISFVILLAITLIKIIIK